MLSALRLGGGLCIVGVVVAEVLVSTAGTGVPVTNDRTILDSWAETGGCQLDRRRTDGDISVRLTLSFDNGPEPAVTPLVLDTLSRHGIKSTFFVIGNKLADPRARACVERAAAEGHWIGNHTWTHSQPLGEQPGRASFEITQTQDALGSLAHPSRWFRPMGGGGAIGPHLLSPDALTLLERDRYSCVLWNSIPRDWAEPDGWVETALGQMGQQEWTLMVLHDLPTGAMTHLDAFLSRAKELGVMFQQEYPPSCVPIVEGSATMSVDHIVAQAVTS